jgi:hypothetical protein
MDVRPGKIEIEIEELALTGLPAAVDGGELGDALRLELERLVAERPPRLGSLLRCADPLRLETTSTTDPAALGRRVAQALHGGLER